MFSILYIHKYKYNNVIYLLYRTKKKKRTFSSVKSEKKRKEKRTYPIDVQE